MFKFEHKSNVEFSKQLTSLFLIRAFYKTEKLPPGLTEVYKKYCNQEILKINISQPEYQKTL